MSQFTDVSTNFIKRVMNPTDAKSYKSNVIDSRCEYDEPNLQVILNLVYNCPIDAIEHSELVKKFINKLPYTKNTHYTFVNKEVNETEEAIMTAHFIIDNKLNHEYI